MGRVVPSGRRMGWRLSMASVICAAGIAQFLGGVAVAQPVEQQGVARSGPRSRDPAASRSSPSSRLDQAERSLPMTCGLRPEPWPSDWHLMVSPALGPRLAALRRLGSDAGAARRPAGHGAGASGRERSGAHEPDGERPRRRRRARSLAEARGRRGRGRQRSSSQSSVVRRAGWSAASARPATADRPSSISGCRRAECRCYHGHMWPGCAAGRGSSLFGLAPDASIISVVKDLAAPYPPERDAVSGVNASEHEIIFEELPRLLRTRRSAMRASGVNASSIAPWLADLMAPAFVGVTNIPRVYAATGPAAI